MHEKIPALRGPSNAILEVIAWGIPIGVDAITAKQSDGNFAIRRSRLATIQNTQGGAKPL
ncbi:MAG: hypothetical protein ABL936_25200 [Aestuariivirga sp.]